jgi:hypothetical protein
VQTVSTSVVLMQLLRAAVFCPKTAVFWLSAFWAAFTAAAAAAFALPTAFCKSACADCTSALAAETAACAVETATAND